ncbi:MetQ/NlpA family ABC transporter substrate-binding protein [Enterovirga aerilata]|uniref:MetQ/NlpA family ABC transporter substrate-binding protein n=1 Tax=Enterovirga aerilata TaxID=2730920 RepID=A0A849IAZ1_9HYPH|nr:MetQ/NlpA family ABC transporter substrate-binding protein [Enterovirga sp. DB1703]NNM73157.1 MetQ/NlpA family ABC transporter substrate-binding protein [Enterovirga sp. DB1703]
MVTSSWTRRLVMAATLAATAAAASSAAAERRLRIGLNPGPTVEFVKRAAALAEKDGLRIETVEFTDWVTPNLALAAGDIDLNFFQNVAYLNTQIEQRRLDLVPVAGALIVPTGLHSRKIKSIAELPDGATVAVANDPLNSARGLLLLQKAGLIRLKDGVGIKATRFDIIENPKKLTIVELEGTQLAVSLSDVHLASISPYVAIPAGIDPAAALLQEDFDNALLQLSFVARRDRAADKDIGLFLKSFLSAEVKSYIADKYPHFKTAW